MDKTDKAHKYESQKTTRMPEGSFLPHIVAAKPQQEGEKRSDRMADGIVFGNHIDLVNEAEKIVRDYSSRGETKKVKKKQDAEFDILLNTVMALSCIMLAVVLGLGAL